MRLIERLWYQPSILAYLLWPLSLIYRAMVTCRRWAYRLGLCRQQQFTLPVIIVGNVTVGGTGKTPCVIALAQLLQQHGLKPAIVSRGYGGRSDHYPQVVHRDSDPRQVGDEPVVMARKLSCSVVVDPQRVRAVHYCLANTDCNVIISDDGLQHYALGRRVEIALIDGQRLLGNAWCLPAGPCREPASRLASVDVCLFNGGEHDPQQQLTYLSTELVNCHNGQRSELTQWQGRRVHAVAGIGNPQRFFQTLREAGVDVIEHAFADHHAFSATDLAFNDELPILMTEKDAVKCHTFASESCYYLDLHCELPAVVLDTLRRREVLPAL